MFSIAVAFEEAVALVGVEAVVVVSVVVVVVEVVESEAVVVAAVSVVLLLLPLLLMLGLSSFCSCLSSRFVAVFRGYPLAIRFPTPAILLDLGERESAMSLAPLVSELSVLIGSERVGGRAEGEFDCGDGCESDGVCVCGGDWCPS